MSVPQTCVVCGNVSTRDVWKNAGVVNGISYVACDFHTLLVTHFCALAQTPSAPGLRKHATTINESHKG